VRPKAGPPGEIQLLNRAITITQPDLKARDTTSAMTACGIAIAAVFIVDVPSFQCRVLGITCSDAIDECRLFGTQSERTPTVIVP